MQRLVRPHDSKPDGRIEMPVLRAKVYELDPGREGDIRDAFSSYYNGGRAPEPKTAWNIGEALAALGTQWMNGIISLVAFGHMGIAAAIISMWIEKTKSENRVDDAWHMIVMAQRLASPSVVDDRAEHLEHHLEDETVESDHAQALYGGEWEIHALADNESAKQVLGDQQLRVIARALVDRVKANVSIDWTLRDTAQARIRVIIKRILNEYGYPPDAQARAVETVLEQAELL